jgi:hypothetical protein
VPALTDCFSALQLQHHFVNTQRVQTTANNKLDAGIQALDKKVRPPGFPFIMWGLEPFLSSAHF